MPPEAWFDGIPWDGVPEHLIGELVAAEPPRPMPKLLGGSSKLAKLAEERRKKAEAAKAGVQDVTNAPSVNSTMSSLERLTLTKAESKSSAQPQARKYVAKQRRETTPPPAPIPVPVIEDKEELPDLRATPSAFAKTLSTSAGSDRKGKMSVDELFGNLKSADAFTKPSPDDIVLKAHGQSKSLNK